MVWNWIGRFVKKCDKTWKIYEKNRDNQLQNGRSRAHNLASNPNPKNSFTRRIVTTSCKTEEVEPGRFVKKCDKTEQILRNWFGRSEVLESKTEHTEEDVTDELKSGTYTIYETTVEYNLMELPIAMTKGVFRLFEFMNRSSDGEPSSSGRSLSRERRQVEIDCAGKAAEESANALLPGKVEDV